jgi:arabinogalactan oligomer/maltooligosaccharide transport system permease protein
LAFLLILPFLGITLFPVVYILATALRDDNVFGSRSLELFSTNSSLINFWQLFTSTDFWLWVRNSFLVSLTSAAVGIFLASTGAYALARFSLPNKKGILLFLAATQMFPVTMMMVPLFLLLAKLELVNSLLGLLILYSSSALPFCIWQLKSYIETIPTELEEAARLDGCNDWQVMTRITLPLAAPGLAVTALFSFMAAWSEYPLASIILQDPALFTAPLGLKSFQSSLATEWGLYAAGSLVISIPAILVFTWLTKYLISGLSLGGVKG